MKSICLAIAMTMGSCLVPASANAADQALNTARTATEFASPRLLGRDSALAPKAKKTMVCDLTESIKLCEYTIKVRKASITVDGETYRICVAEFPYDDLHVKTKANSGPVGILWTLAPDEGEGVKVEDRPLSHDIGYSPGSGVVIAGGSRVISDFEDGFLGNLRLSDRSVVWYAKAVPRGTPFKGRHTAAVVVRLPENEGNLTVCVPVDPPITNTGY